MQGGGLTSCDSEESHIGESYSPVSINLNDDAAALLNYDGNGSRAIYGELDRAGLYQIDENGNITTVAIVFEKTKNNHKAEVMEPLTVKPADVMNIGKDYVIFFDCTYYDKEGDVFGMHSSERAPDGHGLMYHDINYNILLNKNTGKLYALDNLVANPTLDNRYCRLIEDTDGSIIVAKYEPNNNYPGAYTVGRLTISGDNFIYRQLNNNGRGFICDYIMPKANGDIYSAGDGDGAAIFTSGGYDYLEGDGCYYVLGKDEFYNVKYNDWNIPESFWSVSLTPGSNPKETFIDNLPMTSSVTGYFEGNRNLVVSTDTEYMIYDKQTATVNVTNTPLPFKLNPTHVFNSMAWSLEGESKTGFNMYWFNPDNLQYGSIPVKIDGFDLDKVTEDYTLGKVVLYGTLRSNGYNCIATFDLATNQAEIITSAPNLLNVILTPLN